eukprot:sb/3461593/
MKGQQPVVLDKHVSKMSATTYANKNATCVSMTSTSGDYKTGNGPTGSYLNKTSTVFAPNDWHNSNAIMSTTAVRQQNGSLEIRQAARQLRNDTDSLTNWGQHDNTTRLHDRMQDTTAWKEKLEQTITDTDVEIALLTNHKERCETALQNMNTPFEVAQENLSTRSIRVSIDLVDDEVSQELTREVEVINGIKEKLKQKVNEAFQQVCALQDAYNAMCDDLADKMHSLDVDQQCHGLTNQSANIGFHKNATRIAKDIVLPDAWDSHSNYNTQRANSEIRASTALREMINNTIEQTANDLEAQRLRTEYAFRKRIHEVQMAKYSLSPSPVVLLCCNYTIYVSKMSATTYANKNATCVSMTSTSGDYKTGNGPTGSYLNKTSTVFAPNDWHNSNAIMSTTAVRQQNGSLEIRQAARQLRNDTDSLTNWGQHDNTTRLHDRMQDTTAWKEKLEQTITDTDVEIALLTNHKERCETALQNMNTPFEVAQENLSTRSIRVSIDLVDDEVSQELTREVEVINGIKEKLKQKVNEAFQQVCALQDAYNAMCDDLADKMHSLDVDQQCHGLTNQSANIGFHKNATRIAKDIVLPDAWDSHSNYNTQRANSEIRASTALREMINNTIEQTANDLEAQRLRTEYAFRKRIHEVQMAKYSFRWLNIRYPPHQVQMLHDRMQDTTAWKEKLEQTITDTDVEIALLTNHKERCETALQNMNTPFEVAQENLSTRSIRVSIDLVDDEVSQELTREVEVINGIKEKLKQKVNEAFQQVCALQDAYNAMCDDLADKMHSLDVDQQCHGLTNQSANIGFHKNATRIAKDIVLPDAWDSHSNYNTQRANSEIRASTALREMINNTIEQTANDLEAQRLRTEYAFRKRIHEVQMAKDELEWQQRNTKREIDVLMDDIRGLKQAIADKNKPLEVAETRSENRTYRPRVELCRDAPHDGLIEEKNVLQKTVSNLVDKHNTADDALNQLKQTINRIDEDIAIKSDSLELDETCMTKRQKLLLVSHKV